MVPPSLWAMWKSLSPRMRRWISSLAYSALVLIVAGLGYLTYHVVNERRRSAQANGEGTAEREITPLIEISGFSTRVERTSDAERLSVSLRLRSTAAENVSSYVYVLARNDHVSPKLWAVWPPQGPGGAVSAGGHLRSGTPTTGKPIDLTSSWTRITATLDHPPGHAPFDMVIVYVVSPRGAILLSRPYAL